MEDKQPGPAEVLADAFAVAMAKVAEDIAATFMPVFEAVQTALTGTTPAQRALAARLAGEMAPIDLLGKPKAFVFVQPGWGERLAELAPREHDIASPPYDEARHDVASVAEYCNVCENFPCLGGHPPAD